VSEGVADLVERRPQNADFILAKGALALVFLYAFQADGRRGTDDFLVDGPSEYLAN
jgi:hypothetical protein